jgi:DNA-binding NtrC family response regulator
VHRIPALQVSPEALSALVAYRWQGNIRELKNVVERIVLKTTGSIVRPADLPSDIIQPAARPAEAANSVVQIVQSSVAEELVNTMINGGESFWTTVYAQFMARDLTRADLRKIIHLGLENTNGNYRLLVQLFNISPNDYKRFLSFLRKHDCHLPFQQFRAAPARVRTLAAPKNAAAS